MENENKLIPGSTLRKEYVAKKKEEIRGRQNTFIKVISEDVALTEASYEIALHWANRKEPFSD